MNEYKERIRVEITELEEKMGKLGLFMKSQKFNEIDANNRMLLIAQYAIMEKYDECLNLRLTIAEEV